MFPRLRLSLLASALIATAPPALAQSPPNLSGTWVLQVAQSDFGMLPPVDRRTDVIEHAEPRLVVRRTAASQGQESSLVFTYAVDGEPHRNDAGGTEVVTRLRWDGATLVMVTTATSPQGEITITDRYTLSEDGRTLTQARTLSVQGQELAQRMVLTRQ